MSEPQNGKMELVADQDESTVTLLIKCDDASELRLHMSDVEACRLHAGLADTLLGLTAARAKAGDT